MHSHVSIVSNGIMDYLVDVTRDECVQMHSTGILTIGSHTVIAGLKVNQTTSRSITLAGSIKNDGSCKGAQYSDPYGTWDDVVVQGIVTITLQTYFVPINLNTERIHLRSGVMCMLNNPCIDIEGGHTFWDTIQQDSCNFHKYDVLYEGLANNLEDSNYDYPQTVISLETGDTTFALTVKSEQKLCGYTLLKTEHPKLFIMKTTRTEAVIRKKPVAVENLDIFAYVNSKFIYVEKHIRAEMKRLYRDVLIQRCNIEQQVLKNGLTIATQSPDEFAFNIMKGPGYMALPAGEVIHIIKCIPTEVRARKTKECYLQLPVSRGNQSLFLSPRTHILMATGVQTSCNLAAPPMYLLNGNWYKITPEYIEAVPPSILKPTAKPTWKYTDLENLGSSGIYTQETLNQLRDHIMFPAERPAILNAIARGITGQDTVTNGISLRHLLDEDSLKVIAENTWKGYWDQFVKFGSISAGLIMVFMIIRIIKLMVDTLIHGYALHTVYGWSIHLLAAIWDSLTNLLLHLAKPARTEVFNEHQLEKGTELLPTHSDNQSPTAPPTPKPFALNK